MATIGRNDPCPCGSGKKYKKCHGAGPSISPDFLYDRIRQIDGESEELIVEYARRRYGKDFIIRAWHDFLLGDDRPLNPDDPE